MVTLLKNLKLEEGVTVSFELGADSSLDTELSLPPGYDFERAQTEYLATLNPVDEPLSFPLHHLDETLSQEQVHLHEAKRIREQRQDMLLDLNGGYPLDLTEQDKEMASQLLNEAGFPSIYDEI